MSIRESELTKETPESPPLSAEINSPSPKRRENLNKSEDNWRLKLLQKFIY